MLLLAFLFVYLVSCFVLGSYYVLLLVVYVPLIVRCVLRVACCFFCFPRVLLVVCCVVSVVRVVMFA